MPNFSFKDKAFSLIKVFVGTIKDKKLIADDEIIKERLAICEDCSKLKAKVHRGKFWLVCYVCGCEYKRKVSFHASTCPLGKW